MKVYNDQSEYPPDTISFYLYKLNHIENTLFELDFVKPVNIPDWIAEKLHIVNWSYERIKGEASKAILIKNNEWIAKSKIEFGKEIKEGDEHYKAHRSYIIDLENKNNVEIR